jgi:hypothetical protein
MNKFVKLLALVGLISLTTSCTTLDKYKESTADVAGVSLIVHAGNDKIENGNLFHAGEYVKGVFSDNNALLDLPREEMDGYGFKLDLFFANLVRPIPRVWMPGFWTGEPKIQDVPLDKWNDKFGKELADKLRDKMRDVPPHEVHDFHFGVENPWKANYWFVLRLPKSIPYPFISISTPTRSFYLGFKTSKIDPIFTFDPAGDNGDYTWTNKDDIDLAKKNEPRNQYRVAVPSATNRQYRD